MGPLAELPAPGLPDRPLLVVPLGSIEQHGPHLPVSTDLIVAEAVAAALADRLGAVLAPGLPVGASGEHRGFAGVLSIGTEALTTVLVELQRSAADWSAGTVLVNGHGGNAEAVAAAVAQLQHEGHRVLAVPCATRGADAHAGRTETSLLLHLRPDMVGPERPIGSTAPIQDLLPALRAGGVAAVSPSGVLGDARGASAEEGARILGDMVDAAESACRGLVAAVR
ncbi:mycofactocin biosynthesis peptidyl-dipeptidase MftE [Amnibacterium endophyticum]|uniref:Mycofactocin biosynthesis peptidyl-dipeptidase MftE n=1 Tax=Amnibacterium endophyticum TaxID=2109337 RepID=A0ABW4LHV0_9MICO